MKRLLSSIAIMIFVFSVSLANAVVTPYTWGVGYQNYGYDPQYFSQTGSESISSYLLLFGSDPANDLPSVKWYNYPFDFNVDTIDSKNMPFNPFYNNYPVDLYFAILGYVDTSVNGWETLFFC